MEIFYCFYKKLFFKVDIVDYFFIIILFDDLLEILIDWLKCYSQMIMVFVDFVKFFCMLIKVGVYVV